MQGYQVTFFTQQNRRHKHMPLAEWLMIRSARPRRSRCDAVPASEGFGQHRRIHSAHFFDLADQPQEVVMAMTEDEAVRLFEHLIAERIHVFYVKTPVEFGVLGQPDQ